MIPFVLDAYSLAPRSAMIPFVLDAYSLARVMSTESMPAVVTSTVTVTVSMVMVTAVTIAIMGAMATMSTMVGTLMMMGITTIAIRPYNNNKTNT